MPFDMSTVGATTKPHELAYDWKTIATYALGIGAKRDELAYLYEGHKGGMKVYPTFAVVPAYEAVIDLLGRSGADLAMVVHGGQVVRVHKPLPPAATLRTTGTIKGIYDMKKLGQVVLETTTFAGDDHLFDTTWSILVRGGGGFGGPRPPTDGAPEPSIPKNREPDFVHEEATTPEQALLYRIAGDVNPLHADPEFAKMVGFEQGPILHGLCTYGFVARAIVKHCAGGDADRLKTYAAQFRKPVWPGDTLVTKGWKLEDGKVAVTASVQGRADAVLANAWAEIG
jgi:acyl dehydratase